MKSPAPADLQRWSDDVARDAASLSFVPLARAYRRMGRRDAALRLVLRGLEHHPHYVEGHGLLAVLYFELGERTRAYDEWSMVLRLEPDNFDALRGMGFFYLEQEDHAAAKRHLERAAAQKPNDPAVQEALRIIRERLGEAAPEPAAVGALDEPWSVAPVSDADGAHAPVALRDTPFTFIPTPAPAPAPTPIPGPGSPPAPSPSTATAPAAAAETATDDPATIFEPLLKGGQILGALILDSQGLVLGGSLGGGVGTQAEALGAILGGAIEEAVRTAAHLSLGSWQGVLLEADAAVLHFAPVGEGLIVLLAARRDAPTGWVLRSAAHASAIATRFLEAYA